MRTTRIALLEGHQAARPYAVSKPLKIVEAQLDAPGPQELMVRVAAAGLCHSDLSVINGDRPRAIPVALGHEAAGIVAEIGSGVYDLQPGDHVVMVFVPSCGHCASCARGRPALCEPGAVANARGTLFSGERRLMRADQKINHHLGVSAFADYAVVSRHSVVKIDKDIPLDQAALFGCAVLTGVGAVANTASVKLGESVAVVGLGGVGLAAILGALACGAGRVYAVGRSVEKLDLACALGAIPVVNAGSAETLEKIYALSSGGVDHAIDCAGTLEALELALRLTRRGGATTTAGLPSPAVALPVPVAGLVGEERVLRGSYIGSCVPSIDIPRYMDLFRSGRLPIDRLISGRLPLEQINEGFDRLADGKAIRQIIDFGL